MSPGPDPAVPRGARPRGLDWWLVDRRTGRRVVGQSPNPAILVFLGLTVLGWVVPDDAEPWDEVLFVGTRLALGWWAVDEAARGVNPMRRVLGAGALGWVVLTVLRRYV